MTEPIILTQPESFIQKFSKTKVGKVITSPKTTLALGATLATLLTAGAAAPAATSAALRSAPSTLLKVGKKAAPKSVKGAVKGIAGAGIVAGLGASGIKKVTSTIFEKAKTGGEIIAGKKDIKDVLGVEDPGKLLTKENLAKAAKAAGIIGLTAAGAAGVKSLIDKVRSGKQEKELQTQQPGFTEPRQVGLGGIPEDIPSNQQPQISASGAPQSQITPNPIQNIIQIQVS